MEAKTSVNRTTKSHVRLSRRRIRKCLFGALILAVLAGGGAFGWREIQSFRQHRVVGRARELIEVKDYNQAAMSARRALAMNPHDIPTIQMLIELTEAVGSKEAIRWRRAPCNVRTCRGPK